MLLRLRSALKTRRLLRTRLPLPRNDRSRKDVTYNKSVFPLLKQSNHAKCVSIQWILFTSVQQVYMLTVCYTAEQKPSAHQWKYSQMSYYELLQLLVDGSRDTKLQENYISTYGIQGSAFHSGSLPLQLLLWAECAWASWIWCHSEQTCKLHNVQAPLSKMNVLIPSK